jgi:hypothetical protein
LPAAHAAPPPLHPAALSGLPPLPPQGGHTEICKVLVGAGADVLQTCCIPATGEVFGPADISLMHFHMATW